MGHVFERIARVPTSIRVVLGRMPMRFMITTLAGITVIGVLEVALRAEAQQPGKIYRIGFLISASAMVAPTIDAFQEAMRELGYIEGKNYVLEIRARGQKTDHLSNLAAELVGLKVDILLTRGFPALRAAKKATSTIPIVMQTGSDPVKRGIVASLAHPGGNITGVVSIGVALSGKRLELLAEAVPGVKRIAVLTASRRTAAREGPLYKDLEAAAHALGLKLQMLRARDAGEIDKAFLAMTEGQANALLVLPHSQFQDHRERIVKHAAKNRLPAIYSHLAYVESGGLMTYRTKRAENFRRMAIYVDKTLHGANPADLPIEQSRNFELVINLKTAAQLGLTIPDSVLFKADRVIR